MGTRADGADRVFSLIVPCCLRATFPVSRTENLLDEPPENVACCGFPSAIASAPTPERRVFR
jgi:hypothetical protein